MDLSPQEKQFYQKHLLLPQVGDEGQLRLKAARVLVVGAGGLGAPCSLYLAAAGVGTLGILDHDTVDISNLHRQILYQYADVGQRKADLAAVRLRALNPFIEVRALDARLEACNAESIFSEYDLIIDCSDNFPTRYLINDACVLLKKTFVHGAVFQFEGQVSIFSPTEGRPCYRCLFPEPPPRELAPNCAETGVLGVLPATVGSLQATEAIKWLAKIGEPAVGRLITYDALKLRFGSLRVGSDDSCVICSPLATRSDLSHHAEKPHERHFLEVTVSELQALREREPALSIIDIRESYEQTEMLPGAYLSPQRTFVEHVEDFAEKSDQIILYCQSGRRSLRLAETLNAQGLSQFKSLMGGINAWKSESQPLLPTIK
ncbi:MAG: molybdopterin-synthase adenylyltransferase MoeB [Oligoflexales bacterium]